LCQVDLHDVISSWFQQFPASRDGIADPSKRKIRCPIADAITMISRLGAVNVIPLHNCKIENFAPSDA